MPPREIGAVLSSQELKEMAAQRSSHFLCPECGVYHNELINKRNTLELEKKRIIRKKNYLISSDNIIKKKLKNIKKNKNIKNNKKNKIFQFFSFFLSLFY